MTDLLPRDRRQSRYLFDLSPRWCLERNAIQAITGQAGTFTRTSVGTSIGSDGRLSPATHSQPRFHWVDLDGDGVRESVALLLEDARTNLCLQSENFGTTWAAIGTPTRVAAADTTCGVTLDLIGDDSAAAIEGYSQVIAFTGNGVKAISVFVRQGSSTSSVISLVDTTPSTKLFATLTWAAGLPVVTLVTGQAYHGYELCADGKVRLLFTSLAVTAANTNVLSVEPATDAVGSVANVGTLYAGGVQAEDGPFPSSYLKTTAGTLPRSADGLSFPFNALPQALTMYAKIVERGSAQTTVQQSGVAYVGAAAFTDPCFYLGSDTTGRYRGADFGVFSTAAAGPAIGSTVELRALLFADGSVQLGQSINAGAEAVAAQSAAHAMGSAFSAPTLYVNALGTGNVGFNAFVALRIAAGAQSLAYMRAG